MASYCSPAFNFSFMFTQACMKAVADLVIVKGGGGGKKKKGGWGGLPWEMF